MTVGLSAKQVSTSVSVKNKMSRGDAELGATADVLELVVVELWVVVGGVEVALVALVTVTPGVVHTLSVPRIGN